MFRLTLVTLTAIYLTMLLGGEAVEADPNEVARQSPLDDFSFSLASFVVPAAEALPADDTISDDAAIELALAAGKAHRADRQAPVALRGLVAAVEAEPTPQQIDEIRYLWAVSGTLVNLRAGPSTGNEVVAQLSKGTDAAVLDERDGWYRIETVDGATEGWIFGKFLQPRT